MTILWKRRHRIPVRRVRYPAAQTLLPAPWAHHLSASAWHKWYRKDFGSRKSVSCGEEVGATDVELDTLPRRWATEGEAARSDTPPWSQQTPPPPSTGSVWSLIASSELCPAPGFDL